MVVVGSREADKVFRNWLFDACYLATPCPIKSVREVSGFYYYLLFIPHLIHEVTFYIVNPLFSSYRYLEDKAKKDYSSNFARSSDAMLRRVFVRLPLTPLG